ncbi:MAG: peptidoglycan DD-metalloendopeptidase family protein [Oscillospiraceae bacterium]
MKNKKVTSAICIVLAVLMALTLIVSVLGSTAAYAVNQSQIDALEDQKKDLKSKREEMQTSIDDLKDQKADVLQKKQALDEQNEVARQEIELINEQIGLYTQLIEEKAKEVEEAKALEETQYEAYRTHIRAMEENGKYTYLALIFSSKSLSQLMSNIDMVGEIMGADKRLYDQYTAARENTERVKAEYEATLKELTEKQDELETEKKALETQIAAAVKVITDLEADIEEYTKEFDKNAAAEAALASQINTLTAQMKKEEEEARKAAEAANKPYDGAGSTSTGNYTWPCPSSTYVTSGYGWRIHPLFGTKRFHNGIDVSANSGSSVVAADGGTVSIAEYNSSAGNYIVLYHAGGTTTTYMHMSSLAVAAGDTVSKGDTIGYVGSTGWSTGPHLHFEIALNGSRVNPLNYFTNYTMSSDA